MTNKKLTQLSQIIGDIEVGKIGAPDLSAFDGYSGAKIIGSLQAATKLFCDEDNVYLEVGVFRGLTLLSNAQKNPSVPCYGIDNFSLFDEKGENLAFIEQQKNEMNIKNANVVNDDYEAAFESLEKYIGKKKIGVYFVDGPHDYRSQLMGLLLALPYLADDCVIFIDDANYAHVRQANRDFLKVCPDFALLAEAYTPKHIANMTEEEKVGAIVGWWDGLNILVRDPKRTIERWFPKEESKAMYYTSHDVFRHELAERAFDILKLTQKLADSADDVPMTVEEIMLVIQTHRQKNPGLYRHQNTYSENLPSFSLYVLD